MRHRAKSFLLLLMALTLALGISVSAISIGFVKFPFFNWDTPFVSKDNENSISILDADDNALGEMIFGDFRWEELINANIPNEITMLDRDAIGKPQLISVFRIDSLIFNEAIDSGSFSVGTKEAGNVWDSDTKTFLREKK